MGRRPARPIDAHMVAEDPAIWGSMPKTLAVKFYPRFVYLLEELAGRWGIPDTNKSEALRQCLDLYAKDPFPPHNWAAARPRQPREKARVDNPIRPRRVEAVVKPVDPQPFSAVLTIDHIAQLTTWAEQHKSNRTAVMYEAIWQAAVSEGLVDGDAPIDLTAPPGWKA